MTRLILASASAVRCKMLGDAGLEFEAIASDVDEDSIKQRYRSEGCSTPETALYLARAKALDVGRANPGALVIGADQILDLDGRMYDKPTDRDTARRHLESFSGKTHGLVTAAVLFQGRDEIWHHQSTPRLIMRPLSAAFIDDYLDRIGDKAYQSVGAYQLEGPGVQLFEAIEGDFFTILGLPLLPLLAFLRAHGHIAS